MDRKVFKECLGCDLQVGENVRMIGKLEQKDNEIFLNDTTAIVKIQNSPGVVNAYAEIRGTVMSNDTIQHEEHTVFVDDEFDMKDYVELLRVYKRFPELIS